MFIWTDLETTGLDLKTDQILAIGLLITDDSFREIDRWEHVVHVPAGYRGMREMNAHVHEMHTKSGLLQRVADERAEVAEVERKAVAWLDHYLGEPADNIKARPAMAGNSVHFDRAFITRDCPALLQRYSYRSLDVSSLRLLALAETPLASKWIEAQAPAEHLPLADIAASRRELAHWRQVLRAA